MYKLLNSTTDRLIGILFIPWILLIVIPLMPFYKQNFESVDLIFIILWIQLGMVFIISYWTINFLNKTAVDNHKVSIPKFAIHSIVNYLLCTLWLGLSVFSSPNSVLAELVILLILGLVVSEFARLNVIAKLIVSIELDKEAKFKDYFLTLILLPSLCGAWNIHQRIKSIVKRKTTAPNKK